MTRTKNPRKASSIKKEQHDRLCSRSIVHQNEACRSHLEDVNEFLTRIYESTDHLKKEFEQFYENKLKAYNNQYESACSLAKLAFEDTIQNLPEAYLNSLLCSNLEKDSLKCHSKIGDVAASNNRFSKTCKPNQTSNEACEFKRPKTPRPTRSSSRIRSISAPPQTSTPSSDRFKTPTNSLRDLSQMPAITPKVAATPMCFLRRPEHGEVAFAASGSPLLVRRVSLDDIPTVSIPLQDGRIFSILPDPGASAPNLPEFDEETKKYLKTLRKHLELLAPSSP